MVKNLIGLCPWFLGGRLISLHNTKVYAEEMTQDGGLTFKNNPMIQVLGLWTSPTSGEGRGKGLEIEFNHVANDSINHTYAMKPPIKTLDTQLSGAFRLVNTWVCQEGDIPWSFRERAQKLCLEPSYNLLYVSLHLAGFDLFPYNDKL